MAVTSSIDPERGIVTLTYTGTTTFGEWEAEVEQVIHDPRYRAGMCFLSDRRLATDIMSKEYINLILDYIARSAAQFVGCRWAIVTASAADFGMGRMGSFFAERTPVEGRAFMRIEDALGWLATRTAPARD